MRSFREELRLAERSALLTDVNLGSAALTHRDDLMGALSKGVRNAAQQLAEAKGWDPAAAVRFAVDALGRAIHVTFLGSATEKFENKFDNGDVRNNTFYTMLIRLEFEDPHQRSYFQRTVRTYCGLHVVTGFPRSLMHRKDAFNKYLRATYPGEHIFIKIRVGENCAKLIAEHKADGSPVWECCPESWGLDTDEGRPLSTASSNLARVLEAKQEEWQASKAAQKQRAAATGRLAASCPLFTSAVAQMGQTANRSVPHAVKKKREHRASSASVPKASVADPGSGAFLTPGSEIRDPKKIGFFRIRRSQTHTFENLLTIF
jgi:hypothetical protein